MRNFRTTRVEPVTLVDLVRTRGTEEPNRIAYIYLLDGESKELSFSYGQLDKKARAIAALLQSRGLSPGDRVLLLFPPGLDYIAAFFGCLYAGVVAVPAYPPRPHHPMTHLEVIAVDSARWSRWGSCWHQRHC